MTMAHPMIDIPQVFKQSRAPKLDDAGRLHEAELSFEDVEAFVDAESDADFEEIMQGYPDALQPLYGLVNTEWSQDTLTFRMAPLDESETVSDFRNYKNLLTIAMRLCALLERPDIGYQDIENHSVEIVKHSQSPWLSLTHKIELETASATRQFLETGIDNARLDFHMCYISECPDCLQQPPTFLLVIGSHTFYNGANSLRHACEDMFNNLSMIMMHDVSVGIKGRELSLLSRSTASSLWALLLEQFQQGRADCCRVCGKPFIALDERKNKRLYCSGACNKMYQRLLKYNRLIVEGHPATEAAKKAGISIDRARVFWETYRHQRPVR